MACDYKRFGKDYNEEREECQSCIVHNSCRAKYNKTQWVEEVDQLI